MKRMPKGSIVEAGKMYMDCIIERNTQPNKLKYSAYAKDTFLHADTLKGIKQLIKKYLKG